MAKILYLFEAKLAFAELQRHVSLVKTCQDLPQMLQMFLPGGAVHNDIVNVCSRKLLAVVEVFIILWKVAGALWRVKGITQTLKSP